MAHGAAVFTLADVFYTLFLAFLNNTNGAMGTSQILYKCIPCYRFLWLRIAVRFSLLTNRIESPIHIYLRAYELCTFAIFFKHVFCFVRMLYFSSIASSMSAS